MRIFKNKTFNKWAKALGLSDENICDAAHEIAAEDYEASLGKKVFKKRIAIGNTGKSGGTRTIVAYQKDNNIFFMYGFAKSKKGNISTDEKKALQKLAGDYFRYSEKQLNDKVKKQHLFEIKEVKSNG